MTTKGWVWFVAFIGLCGCRAPGHHQDAGKITPQRVDEKVIAQRAERDRAAAPAGRAAKQILFGDLHVHTTFSADAFIASLPMLQGEGAHPPADACDFARFCSALDFWSINDHAENITPDHWRETKEAIRQCNAVAGDAKNPDVVAFLGWEWTQVGRTPKDHYGHKNVIVRETAEDRVPKRPISALSPQLVGALRNRPPFWQRIQFPLNDWANRQRYFDFEQFQSEMRAVPMCAEGVDTRELPADCHEKADTPQELFEKLAQWGFDAIVIPHGTTWGLYTPPGTTFDKQLVAAQQPEKQWLFEVYSGHGNSEEYRAWSAVQHDANGNDVCPAPAKDYEPCCWRAGEIIRSRCGDAAPEECEQRVREARQNYVDAGVLGRQTVPGTSVADWKDCGYCRDCFAPAYNMQPGNSAQYALAIRNFDDPANPRGFLFGFIASSDNHSARPGTGYKEFARHGMTEAVGTRDPSWRTRVLGPEAPPSPRSVAFDPNAPRRGLQAFQLLDVERQASFFMTGGLVAVHAEGRDRDAIWHALERREVYGTSGDRILLWFDLLNGPAGALPMGSETRLAETPRFRVRAVGALVQKPGCPESSTQALTPDRLQRLCHGECYNPGDERRRITRIEVVRIRPQQRAGEPVAPLIEDPWKRIDCPADPAGCAVDFADGDFAAGGRDTIYYARAIEEPSPAVNAAALRCTYDSSGQCIEAHPCYGDYRTPFADDCLSTNEERAWSSPIYLWRSS
jgi:Protein of unknown function (DUF3604)